LADDTVELARARSRAQADQMLVERSRIAVRSVLLIVPLFALADVYVNPQHLRPLFLQKLAHVTVAVLSLVLLRRHPVRSWAAPITLFNMAVALFLTVTTSMIVGDDMTVPLLGVVLVAISAAALPWGLTEHLLVLAIAITATVFNLFVVSREFPAEHTYRAVAIVTVWVLSVYLCWELERRRFAEAKESIERERAQAALRRRFDFEQLITGISARFINLAPDEIDRGIGAALRAIAEFAGIDRSYVFLLSEDRKSMSLTHWWVPEGSDPPVADFRALPLERYPWLLERLRRGDVVHVSSPE